MAFKSLSKTIRTQVQELDKQKGTNAPLRSTVRNYLNPVYVVNNNEEEIEARNFMADLIDQARLPKTETAVYVDTFANVLHKAPNADLNIFGLEKNPNFNFMNKMVDETQTTCLFIRDSGLENIFA